RIQRRMDRHFEEQAGAFPYPRGVVAGFVGALLFGALLSAFFVSGQEQITLYMAGSIFILALLFPIYRAEYVLGFVVSMTFTFGSVLPTVVGAILVLAAAALYRYIRPQPGRIIGWLTGKRRRVAAAGSTD